MFSSDGGRWGLRMTWFPAVQGRQHPISMAARLSSSCGCCGRCGCSRLSKPAGPREEARSKTAHPPDEKGEASVLAASSPLLRAFLHLQRQRHKTKAG